MAVVAPESEIDEGLRLVVERERGRKLEDDGTEFRAEPVYTLEEALAIAEDITGIPAPRLRASPGVLRAMSAVMTPIEKVVPVPPAYTAESGLTEKMRIPVEVLAKLFGDTQDQTPDQCPSTKRRGLSQRPDEITSGVKKQGSLL